MMIVRKRGEMTSVELFLLLFAVAGLGYSIGDFVGFNAGLRLASETVLNVLQKPEDNT